MATERPSPTLLHELLVAHDERHSYMQRMYSLAGPGAYTIPSTFQRPAPNLLIRVVQRENYGREFARQKRVTKATRAGAATIDAPCQLCLVTMADAHRDRREQLRKLLQVDHWCQDETPVVAAERGRRAVADSSASSPASPDDRVRRPPSPSSHRAGSPSERGHWISAGLTDIVADFGEPAEVEEEDELPSEDIARGQRQQASAPPTYQHFLMRTSYLERLKKQHQRRRR
ncbi:hypothetical protein PHYPSEUDO_009863 [Phytophthora pseudosyringae]|uniref:Uncharacterized protein n=1 Tax=Phytophthora pseudosyringae TaxID=221518 RepID=A0A8T1W6W2_9STRA|nr:hypothetical protein PHYPSEUDO_009863 [Phytophthora pseudosyringae]